MKKILNDHIKYYNDFGHFVQCIHDDYGERNAVEWYDRKANLYTRSYRHLTEDIYKLVHWLDNKGLNGKNLAIIGENSYQWLLVYMAAAVSGGTAVCVDMEQPVAVIQQMLEMSDIKAVFASSSCLPLVEEQQSNGTPCFLLGNGKDGLTGIDEVLEGIDSAKIDPDPAKVLNGNSTAAIVFTSGTTGVSKPVMLSHRALLVNGCECNVYVDGGMRAFSALPLCHTYGMTCAVLATWARGASLILNGNLKTVMRDLQAANAFSILTVPLMVEAIHNQMWLQARQSGKESILKKIFLMERLKRKVGMKSTGKALTELRKKVLGELSVIICGGAHMDKDISEEFELMGLIMLQGYGITECGPLVAVNGNQARKLDSVGMVLPSCQIKLEDEEILVRGKNLMNGYYRMPEETAEVMEGEWFKTGDIGMVDKDGFLYIVGRKKNIIVFKNGKKISPERLEQEIKKNSLVKNVMVYGAASGVSADDVKLAASIFPDEEATKDMSSYEILKEVQRHIDSINDTLPLYQQIQMVNLREEDFEKTAMMKIKRHLVK
ncbi:AMP-binding protein [Ihubacter sp. rT4E-8]|uniref:AMP-binding protein n=1 Tax=Ihubacter sp. rT4E-8 TaxID=3242369 RepID=UPI003CF9F8BF